MLHIISIRLSHITRRRCKYAYYRNCSTCLLLFTDIPCFIRWTLFCYFSATDAIKENFPEIYLYDPTPIPEALWRVCKGCASVEKRGEYYIWDNRDVKEELLKVDPSKDLAQRA